MSGITSALPSRAILDMTTHNQEYLRSPSSVSPSSRKESLRNGSIEEFPSSMTTTPPLARKRAASLNTDAANQHAMDNMALTSDSATSSTGRYPVCLCQPEPKIPRPRNAFILYRQNHQAQVVAQHPGLANPEISKIIGEQWRAQPIEVQEVWRRLADEEKARHQRQYPDYKYQPKRAGKTTPKVLSPDGENSRCPKCGGHYILTPTVPLTPFERSSRLPTPISASQPTTNNSKEHSQTSLERDREYETGLRYPHAIMNSPHQSQDGGENQRNRARIPPSARDLRLRPPIRDDELESPNYKRRRLEYSSSAYSPQTPLYSSSSSHRVGAPSRQIPLSAGIYPDERRTVFHGQAQYSMDRVAVDRDPRSASSYSVERMAVERDPRSAGGMEPPPRPQHVFFHGPRERSRARYDESLRLPPLQTPHGATAPIREGSSTIRMGPEHLQRSVQAMVMTIPFLNKIKVLAKISPPLAPPGPTSPVPDVRGAVIAVEGTDAIQVAEVGDFVHDYLTRGSEYLVNCWNLPYLSQTNTIERIQGSEPDTTSIADRATNFPKYLEEINIWHERSDDIARFITTVPSPDAPQDSIGPPQDATSSSGHVSRSNSRRSSFDVEANQSSNQDQLGSPTATAAAMILFKSEVPRGSSATDKPPKSRRIPIAILPHGFSVTTSDHFASLIPINDSYAPVDHWQWMATLWRGIIGPDLTIYVKSISPDGQNEPGLLEKEELTRIGGVEVRQDIRTIVVRTESGNGRRVEEKTLRRLGFEVLEFIRAETGGNYERS